jgi:hypothetical protein
LKYRIPKFLLGHWTGAISLLLAATVYSTPQQPASTQPAVTPLKMTPDALDSLVVPVAKKILQYRVKNVIVIGAAGPEPDVPTQFGQQLGDDFSDALAKQSKDFDVGDRAALRDYIKKKGVSEAMVVSDALANWMAVKVNTQGFVLLQIKKLSEGKIRIIAFLYRTAVDEGDWLFTADTEIDLTAEEQQKAFLPIDSDWNKTTYSEEEFSKLPLDRVPHCDSCPKPEMTKLSESFSHVRDGGSGISEKVVMYVTILPDGTAADIAVIKSARFGLNAPAVEIIAQKWRFKPAKDADGNPTPFRVNAEITYQTY